jgi:hypothetical protein
MQILFFVVYFSGIRLKIGENIFLFFIFLKYDTHLSFSFKNVFFKTVIFY